MSASFWKFYIFIIFILTLSIYTHSQSRPFTATDNHKIKRISSPAISLDGKYVVFGVREWNEESGKVSNYLQYQDLKTSKTGTLTKPETGSDMSPLFSKSYPDLIFFTSTRSGKSSLWYMKFDPTSSHEPENLKEYPVDLENFKIQNNIVVFSSEVYKDCTTLQCTAELIAKEDPEYFAYDKMFVRHWDRWHTNRVNHIFVLRLDTKEIDQVKYPVAKLDPVDIMTSFDSNSPIPPYGGSELFDISPNNNELVYTRLDRTHDESWNTGWQTYTVSLEGENLIPSQNHYFLTKHTTARTQNPKYSKDGRKIAYLAMDRPGLESDNLHLEVFNFYTYKIEKIINENFDNSIVDYAWHDDNTILFVMTEKGLNKLFSFNLETKKYKLEIDDKECNYNLPLRIPGTSKYIIQRTSMLFPDELVAFNYEFNRSTSPLTADNLIKLTDINREFLSNFKFSPFESFTFVGGYGDEVQGYVMWPLGFKTGKKYPLAFLIHGGPEGAWESSWSYRWNPQLWAQRGYAVVMINPHGSSGMGIKFQDAVRDDWGGVPYNDLMLGLNYVVTTYDWIDGEKACACGASYGGYMVNWIQGHTDKFKCLVTHDGVFSTLAMFYETEEIWFPLAEYCPHDKLGCKPYDDKFRENYVKWSPEAFVDNWKTPHLIIHGSKDYRIPIGEGLAAFNALQLKKVPSKFLHFDEENHWVLKPENSIVWNNEVLGWLDKYTNNTQTAN